MSQEAVPDQAAVPEQQGAPKGLLQQMEELMAALNADLSDLSTDLHSPGNRPPVSPTHNTPDSTASGSDGPGTPYGTDRPGRDLPTD